MARTDTAAFGIYSSNAIAEIAVDQLIAREDFQTTMSPYSCRTFADPGTSLRKKTRKLLKERQPARVLEASSAEHSEEVSKAKDILNATGADDIAATGESALGVISKDKDVA